MVLYMSKLAKQITLLGQNIDAWGRDLTPKQKFSDLLHAVGKVKGIERVRFVTRYDALLHFPRGERQYTSLCAPHATIPHLPFLHSHPRYMSLNVVDAVASIPNMCEMFHVPFQSGDDEILKRMSR